MPKVSCPYCGQPYSYETLSADRSIHCESCDRSFVVAEPGSQPPPRRSNAVLLAGMAVIAVLLAGSAVLLWSVLKEKQALPPSPPVAATDTPVIAPTVNSRPDTEVLLAEIRQLREELDAYRKMTDATLLAHTDRLEQVKQFDSSTLDYINYYNNYFQSVEAFAAGERELNAQYENAFKELYTVCTRQNEVLGLTSNYASNGSVLGRLNNLENQLAALSENYNNNNYNGLWSGWGTTVIIPNWHRPHPPRPPKPPKPPKPPEPRPEPRPTPKPEPRPEPRPTPKPEPRPGIGPVPLTMEAPAQSGN